MKCFQGWLIRTSIAALLGFGASLNAAEPAKGIDTAFVPQEAFAAVVTHPRRVLSSPELELWPIEVISVAAKQELGVDPLDIEQVLSVFAWPEPGEPPVGGVLRFVRPYDPATALAKILAGAEERSVGQRTYRYAPRHQMSVCFVDPQTIVLGSDAMVRKMLTAEHVETPLTRLLTVGDAAADVAGFVAVDAIRGKIKPLLTMLPPLPPPLKNLSKLPDLLDSLEFQMQVSVGRQQLVLNAADEPAAIEAQEILKQALAFGQQMALANVPPLGGKNDEIEQALQHYLRRLSDRVVAALEPQRKGNTLKIAGESVHGVAQTGVLVGLLLPAINNARQAGQRTVSMNNLRNLAIAMLSYDNLHGRFPPRCSYSADGKPLLSWRVHLLPTVDRLDLYRQFHLDEPWDSPHNKSLIPLMPEFFHSPDDPRATSEGKTLYQVPIAEGTIFGDQEPLKLAAIRDGTSNTILMVEADSDAAVIWTKPDDLTIDLKRPLEHLGKLRPQGFLAVMADGSVHAIAIDRGNEFVKALFTAQGGEPIVGGF